jgi:hypothetical protein
MSDRKKGGSQLHFTKQIPSFLKQYSNLLSSESKKNYLGEVEGYESMKSNLSVEDSVKDGALIISDNPADKDDANLKHINANEKVSKERLDIKVADSTTVSIDKLKESDDFETVRYVSKRKVTPLESKSPNSSTKKVCRKGNGKQKNLLSFDDEEA